MSKFASTMREIIKILWRMGILFLLAVCILLWISQTFYLLVAYLRNGLSGVKGVIGHWMLSNTYATEWDVVNMYDFALIELKLLLITIIAWFVNRRILGEFSRELKDYIRSLRPPSP